MERLKEYKYAFVYNRKDLKKEWIKYIPTTFIKDIIKERYIKSIGGINNWNEKPKDFEQRQFENENYKIKDGESRKEVTDRMHNALINILKNNKGKKIVIVSHATAITFLLMKLGQYKDNSIYFNDKIIIDKDFVWNAPEVFKLTFDNSKLINIDNIR